MNTIKNWIDGTKSNLSKPFQYISLKDSKHFFSGQTPLGLFFQFCFYIRKVSNKKAVGKPTADYEKKRDLEKLLSFI